MKLSAFSRQRSVKEKPVGGWRRAESWRLKACGAKRMKLSAFSHERSAKE
jgi:hypothetical protein